MAPSGAGTGSEQTPKVSCPTWELLNQLLDRGWPKSWIARELGGHGATLGLQIRTDKVTAATAQRVQYLADWIGDLRRPGIDRAALPPLSELEAGG